MLDLNQIVDSTDFVAKKLRMRGENTEVLGVIKGLNEKRRNLTKEIDEKRSDRNFVSKKIGQEKRPPTEQEKRDMRNLGGAIELLEKKLSDIQVDLNNRLAALPNLPLDDVPEGLSEENNEVVEEFGEKREIPWSKPHWDIAQKFELFNLPAGAKIAGARFYLLCGDGARMNRALSNWLLDTNTKRFGYTEMEPPEIVKKETMFASGNLPKFSNELYHDDETDLWLIPTSEVSLNSIWRDEIIPNGLLPQKYVSLTSCFRKEHTAGGRDVRGIKRVHQFKKVELYRCEEPENSQNAQLEMVNEVKNLCIDLGLSGRIVKLCAGDMGFQAARTFDIEVYAPGAKEWYEVSSISTCTDFQARRGGMRYRPKAEQKPKFIHTLNGSGLALPRIWAALLESGLSRDSKQIDIPKVLQPYFGADKISAP